MECDHKRKGKKKKQRGSAWGTQWKGPESVAACTERGCFSQNHMKKENLSAKKVIISIQEFWA